MNDQRPFDIPTAQQFFSEFDSSEYSESAKAFLGALTQEQLDAVKARKFFHVTDEANLASIQERGLIRGAAIADDEDFRFMQEMFDRYGTTDPNDRRMFEALVMGKRDGEHRPLSLSTSPVTEGYQIPERVSFMLRNMKLLVNASYTTPEEKERCRAVLEKYEESFAAGKRVCVLSVSFACPVILNNLVPPDVGRVSPADLFEALMVYSDADGKLDADIPWRYLAVEETMELDREQLDEFLAGRPIGFD